MKRLLASILTGLTVLTSTVTSYGKGALPFTDIKSTDWYYSAVGYVYENGLFYGTSSTEFSPGKPMNRAMFIQVLANLSKPDLSGYTSVHFLDVKDSDWFAKPVEWAAQHDLTNGADIYMFAPTQSITREQAVTFLYRYAQKTNNLTDEGRGGKAFRDYASVSSWAKEAVDWAVAHGILNGDAQKRLNPRGTATRAEMAQIFVNFHRQITGTDVGPATGKLPVPSALDREVYGMSASELVGQVFLPRYPTYSDAAYMTRQYHPAGWVMFKVDFDGKTEAQVQAMIRNVQSASKIPLFIAVDEEGGTVVRVSSNPNLAAQAFDSVQNVYNRGGLEGVREDTRQKARLLTGLGINMNLAPVCDVSTDPNDFIYARSTGQDAATSAEIIGAIVEEMNEAGLYASLKHFPGYGNNVDTHTGISIDKRPYSQFVAEDFLPFQAGISQDAASVLVSHNIVNCMDPERPASLSKPVHDILRKELGFDRLIMTDDLSMGAIKEYTGGQSPAVTAFLAGNDLLLTSDFVQDYNAMMDAVAKGTVSTARLRESVKRILRAKHQGLY